MCLHSSSQASIAFSQGNPSKLTWMHTLNTGNEVCVQLFNLLRKVPLNFKANNINMRAPARQTWHGTCTHAGPQLLIHPVTGRTSCMGELQTRMRSSRSQLTALAHVRPKWQNTHLFECKKQLTKGAVMASLISHGEL